MESLESRLLLSALDPFTGKTTYTDGYGSVVTVTISGPGEGQLTFPDGIKYIDGHAMPEADVTNHAFPALSVTDATSKTVVTITVKNARDKSWKETDLVGLSITGDGFKALHAAGVNIVYSVIEPVPVGGGSYDPVWVDQMTAVVNIENAAGAKITLGDLRYVNMTLGGETAGKTVTSLKLGTVDWDSVISAPGLAMSLTATSFDGPFNNVKGAIRNTVLAKNFTTITVKESFVGAILTTWSDVKGVSVGTMKVGQVFYGGIHGWNTDTETFVSAGRINTLTAGTFEYLSVGADSLGTLTAAGYKEGKSTILGCIHDGTVVLAGGDVTKGNTLNTVKTTGGVAAGFAVNKGDIGTITIGRDFTGNIENWNSDLSRYTGSIKSMTAGMITGGGSVSVASIGSLTVTGYTNGGAKIAGDLKGGTVRLSGYGVEKGNTLNTLKVTGNLSASVRVEQGSVGTVTVGGNLSGGVYAWDGSLGSLKVTGHLSGNVEADGLNSTIGTVSVGKVFSGYVCAGSAHVPELGWWEYTGTIKSMTVGVYDDDGWIDSGSIGTLTVKGYKEGKMKVSGDFLSGFYISGYDITKGNVLNTFNIQGTLYRGSNGWYIEVHGDVGSITMGDMATGNLWIDGKVKSITIKKTVEFDETGTVDHNYPSGGVWAGDYRGRMLVNGGAKVTAGKTKFTLTKSYNPRFVTGLPAIV